MTRETHLFEVPAGEAALQPLSRANFAPEPSDFSGEWSRARNPSGFELLEITYAAGSASADHCHPRALLIYTIAGTYLETYENGKTATCAPGVLRYLPAGVKRRNVFTAGARCIVAAISPETWKTALGSPRFDQPVELHGLVAQWLSHRLFAEFYRDDSLSLVALEGILLQLLVELGRNSGSIHAVAAPPRWLRAAREFAESNFLRSFRHTEIAAAVGVHRIHLAREFRRYYSVTIGEFVTRRRLEHACRLLSATDDALADIAAACGFSDQSHFGSTFRRHVGLTPARFRQMTLTTTA